MLNGNKEYFDVVNKDDNVIGKASRKECHSNPRLMHRGVCVIVTDNTGRILLQQRNMSMDMCKGKWDFSASGHNNLGENYDKAAKRELKEELGLSLTLKKIGKMLVNMKNQTEFDVIFSARINDSTLRIDFDKNEISEVRFFTLDELRSIPEQNLVDNFWDIMNFYLASR